LPPSSSTGSSDRGDAATRAIQYLVRLGETTTLLEKKDRIAAKKQLGRFAVCCFIPTPSFGLTLFWPFFCPQNVHDLSGDSVWRSRGACLSCRLFLLFNGKSLAALEKSDYRIYGTLDSFLIVFLQVLRKERAQFEKDLSHTCFCFY
jgi:hypothetical protein